MNREPKLGERVTWKSHGGETHGKVVKKLLKPRRIKSHAVGASPGNPEFLVETDEAPRRRTRRAP